jgi:hypothetical protein
MNAIQTQIMDYLTRTGTSASPNLLRVKLKVSEAVVRQESAALVESGAIRQTRHGRGVSGYYVPSESEIAAESKLRTVAQANPLKPRTAHLEAVMKARAAREQIRIIG